MSRTLRGAAVLALLVLSGGVTTAGAAEGNLVPDHSVLRALEQADSVMVHRLGGALPEGERETDPARALLGQRVLDRVRASGSWQHHAAQLLADMLVYGETPTTRRRLSDPRRARYAFTFMDGAEPVTALMDLGDPYVELRLGAELVGHGCPAPVQWEALVELVRGAFPRDLEVRRLRLIPPVAESYVYVDTLPRPLESPTPLYPQRARDARIQGTVLLQVLVDADGHASRIRVLEPVAELTDAAIASARLWRFRPGMVSGRPVAVWVVLPMSFSLE